MKEINIIAPNIKTGGGKELLKYLLDYLDENYREIKVIVYVDKTFNINNTQDRTVIFVNSKLKKLSLFFKKFTNVIYFGNIPPMVNSETSIVYFHNLYLLMNLSQLFTKRNNKLINLIKVMLQQFYIRIFISNINLVAVQSESVKNNFMKKYHFENVKVMPFYRLCSNEKVNKVVEYDFCYISLAHPHKNHMNLLEALEQLANKKVTLSIALTIENEKKELLNKIEKINQIGYVKIYNHGVVSKDIVCEIYGKSKCLIFPSKEESFGLALVEAVEKGLDVISSNLDYVYEVIEPSVTFDPDDPKDIVDSIERYINTNVQKSINKTNNKIADLINLVLKVEQ